MATDLSRVQSLFLKVVESSDPAGYAAALDRVCAGDAELRRRVEGLLEAHHRPAELLDWPIVGRDGRAAWPYGWAPGEAPGGETETPDRPFPVIPDYEILGELGRGGMGVVFEARQVSLNRPVALKMIRVGVLAGEDELRRFRNEAQAVALLDHPGIVPVYEVGEHGGQPYFSMRLVPEGSLATHLSRYTGDPRAAARLVAEAADAVAHAHARGILHRDLKPANILVDHEGRPHITDFGLAKRIGDEAELTATGVVLGSPGYMAPEQATGPRGGITTATDVYGLGAVLYALLTGRPPFAGESLFVTLDSLLTRPPESPTTLNARVPRDLETICLKCLEKEPHRRYPTAQALADDLRSWLGERPIAARPVPPWERAIKWARRRPAIATLVVAVHLLLASLLGLGTWSYVEIDRSLTTANRHAEDLAWEDYINRVNRAYREVENDNVALAEDLLHGCPTGRRGWEWHHVNRLCHPERLSLEVTAGSVIAIAFSPDGRRIATGTGGPYSAGRGGPNVELWDRETGRRKLALRGTEHRIWSLAFSPDGTKLAVGGTKPQIEIRHAQTGEVLWSKHEPRLPQAMTLAFSPDGRSLAVGHGVYSGVDAFSVALYEVATGQEMATFPGPKGGVNDLAFHPDGRHIAVAGSPAVEVWDVAGPLRVRELRGHTNWVYGVAYSPDGKWLATGGWDRTVKLWDAATGVERRSVSGHEGSVLDLAFGPDSRSLVSAGEDRSVRLWEVPGGHRVGAFHGHTDFVQAVSFAPGGRELASSGQDGTLKIWDRRTSLPVIIDEVETGMMGLWYRRDGRRVVVATPGQGGVTRKGWDPGTGELDPTLTGISRSELQDGFLPYPAQISPGVPIPTATSPDAKLLARALLGGASLSQRERRGEDASGTVEVRDISAARVLCTLVGHTAAVICIAFSPDGRRIATGSYDRTVKLWDTASGREVLTLRGHADAVIALTFSPDGRRIVSGGNDRTARVWDATPLPVETLRAQETRYQEKRTGLQALRDPSGAEQSAGTANDLSLLRRWDMSADDIGKSVEADQDNLSLRYLHLLTLLEAGDGTRVRRASDDLLKHFGKTTDPERANKVAWYCVLAPDAVADHEAPVRLAEAALDGPPQGARAGGDAHMTLGAALYRAGRFEEAVRRLCESIQTRRDGGDPRGFAFLAMAHHRLGRREEAQRWLDQVVAYRPEEGFDFSRDDVEIRILHREAESIILGSPPSVPGPSPLRQPGR